MSTRGQGERWELARTARAAGEARRHLDAYLDAERDGLAEEGWRRARLLVSELATNAVRHGAGRILLEIDETGAGVRVTVSDEGGGGRPTQRDPGVDGGYGLHLLADLSDRWGQGGPGTTVWFEVDR